MKVLNWLKTHWFRISIVTLLLLLVLMLLAIFGAMTEEQFSDSRTATTTRLYINKDEAYFRSCPSMKCDVLLTFNQNSYFDFPNVMNIRSVVDLPEWAPVTGYDYQNPEKLIDGYIHKSNFSDTMIVKEEKPQVVTQTRVVERDSQITSVDIKPYLSGVVNISCYGNPSVSGSGSIWNIPGKGQGILTNAHVTSRNIQTGKNCRIYSGNGGFLVEVASGNSFYWNNQTDAVAHRLTPDVENIPESTLSSLNYSISKMPWCPKDTPSGTPLVIVGFPAYATKVEDYGDGMVATASYQTVTNGIVSGHDTEPKFKGLPTADYFISAKIDSGNSGGIAFAKVDGKMCLLGIPTWVSLGNYETGGLVQNIHNVFYKP